MPSFTVIVHQLLVAERALIETLADELALDEPRVSDPDEVAGCDRRHAQLRWNESSSAMARLVVHLDGRPCGSVDVTIPVDSLLAVEAGDVDWRRELHDTTAFVDLIEHARFRAGLSEWSDMATRIIGELERAREVVLDALAAHAPLASIDLKIEETSEGWFVTATLPTIDEASAEQIKAAIEQALAPYVPADVYATVRALPGASAI